MLEKIYEDGASTPLHKQAWSLLVELYLTTYQVDKASVMISDDKLADQVIHIVSLYTTAAAISLVVRRYLLSTPAASGACVCTHVHRQLTVGTC